MSQYNNNHGSEGSLTLLLQWSCFLQHLFKHHLSPQSGRSQLVRYSCPLVAKNMSRNCKYLSGNGNRATPKVTEQVLAEQGCPHPVLEGCNQARFFVLSCRKSFYQGKWDLRWKQKSQLDPFHPRGLGLDTLCGGKSNTGDDVTHWIFTLSQTSTYLQRTNTLLSSYCHLEEKKKTFKCRLKVMV